MSEDSPFFYLDTNHQPDFLTGLASVTITRANGETRRIDLAASPLQIVEEHPPVDRMEGDWGAICEVYRKKSDYYVTGLPLQTGDVITLTYSNSRETALKVMEIEGARARVERI